VFRWLLGSLLCAGCALGADGGLLTQPTGQPRGGSVTGHAAIGGGGMSTSDYLVAVGIDTRVDVASGGSRWTGGASALGGVKLLGTFVTARIGVWRAITSSTTEASAVPSFELGAYVPLEEHFDPKYPEHGASSDGVVIGVREDLDHESYFTVFVGYALFIAPGY